METTHLQSSLLSDKAWKAVSRQLSDRGRITIFYLGELWEDERFQQDWTRLREDYTAHWSQAVREFRNLASEVETEHAETMLELESLATELLYLMLEDAAECVVPLAELWNLPPVIVWALCEYLSHEPTGVHSDVPDLWKHVCCFASLSTITDPDWFQHATSVFSGELGMLRVLIVYADRRLRIDAMLEVEQYIQLPPGVHIPATGESKREYLKRVETQLLLEIEILSCNCGEEWCLPVKAIVREMGALERFMRMLAYPFHNPRNAISAILALAEDYYEKCAAKQCLQVSNLNDETLALYARQAYLRVVQKKSWSEIAEKVNLSRSAVAGSTPKAIDLLGIRR